ncbi:hypothetical protein QA640_14795 [Bradyrhizobium sp. CB82]|uniref:hypothetical protein n=1 Tax=Bradyrhizobium sp. CB82 TaxID=3039159 RepID=UPI0024B078B7|nr:hypothetical protein [Bradyrhizobium sp. CB82]WFU43591.1 hypothetical protein QA640_14795 [Bradyrhizobium sp. CB82]
MRDYRTHLEKLRQDAADCQVIATLATDSSKRDMFRRLAMHLSRLADEVERELSLECQKRPH